MIAVQSHKFQMTCGLGSLWHIKSPTIFHLLITALAR